MSIIPVDRGVLNPVVFLDSGRMKPEVRFKLLLAALDFYETIDVELPILDIVLTGSNAQYTYTDTSDMDVHIVSNLDETGNPELARLYLDAARSLWGIRRNVKIKSHPVEMYVEDENTKPPSASYSIVDDKWIKEPVHEIPDTPEEEVRSKISEYLDMIKQADGIEELRNVLARFYELRRDGLRSFGEASADNLAFKSLRNAGVLDMLRQIIYRHEDERLSIPEGLRRRKNSLISYPSWLRLS